MGVVWLLSAAFVLLLAWQALAGWPLSRQVVVRLKPPNEDGIQEGRIPPKIPVLDWNAPLVRVSYGWHEMSQVWTADRLRSATVPASRVKGRSVQVKLPATVLDDQAAPGQTANIAQCQVATAWLLGWLDSAWAVLGFLTLTSLLAWVGHPWLAATRARVRKAPVTATLLGVAFAGAVLVRLVGFSYPEWQNDSPGYFKPALEWLSGREISVTDRPFAYPAYIALLLKLTGDMRTLVAGQQLSTLCAALAAGVVLYGAARRLFPPGAWRMLARAVAVGAVVLIGYNERLLLREWAMLAEALAGGWIGLQLWLCWRLMTRPAPKIRVLWEFALFCLLGWLTFFTRPNWAFALALLPAPLVCVAALRSGTRREFVHWLGAALAIVAASTVAAWGVQRLTPENTQAAVEIRTRVLVCWHADLIRGEIARRLAATPPDREALLLQEMRETIERELALAKVNGYGAFQELGYDADRLFYVGIQANKEYWALDTFARSAFCQRLFTGMVLHQPGGYVRKVARQMRLYLVEPYAPPSINLNHVLGGLLNSRKLVQKAPSYFPPALRARYQATLEEAELSLQGGWPSPPRAAMMMRLDPIYRALNPLFAWLISLPLLVTFAALIWAPWRQAVRWRKHAPVFAIAVWALGSSLVSALTCSVLQSLEIQRYVDLFLPLTLLAELLWPFIGAALLSDLFRSRNLAPRCSYSGR